MGRAPTVAVVVLDWDGGEDTLACLASVYASEGVGLRVLLVDNASRAPVIDEAMRRFPGLEVRRNARNLGYAGGNNVGLRWALEEGAEYVVVLNNDATVAPDALRELARVAERDPTTAAVGARILRQDDPARLWMAWGEITYRQSLVRLVGEGAPDGPAFARERDVPWVSGCAILLTRRAIERIGPFDEEYFAYHEEVDWCARAREAGMRVVYAARAVVVHRGQASSGERRYVSRKQYLAARNMIRFVRRHATRWEKARFAVFFVGSLPFQLLRRSLRGEQRGVWLKVRGAVDAMLDRPIPRADLELD